MTKPILRSHFTINITNYNFVHKLQREVFFRKAQWFVRDNPVLLILQANKAGCTVAMTNNSYIEDCIRIKRIKLKKTHTDLLKSLAIKNELDSATATNLLFTMLSHQSCNVYPRITWKRFTYDPLSAV